MRIVWKKGVNIRELEIIIAYAVNTRAGIAAVRSEANSGIVTVRDHTGRAFKVTISQIEGPKWKS
jgi:hypothetical protein